MKNTNYALIVILFLLSFNAVAQTKEYYFTPKWTVGEKKTITIQENEKKFKNSVLVEDTTTYLNGEMLVLKDNGDNYTLKLLYDNVALKAVESFYSKMGEDLKAYKKLELIYKINKKDGSAELLNYKEVQDFMNQSFNQIHSLLKKKNPDMASMSKLILMPVQEAFKNKENIEAYMSREIGDILYPYGKNYQIGDTIKVVEESVNPFSPTDTVSQTTISYLGQVNAASNSCDIYKVINLDLEKFKQILTSMLVKISSSVKTTPEQKKKMDEDIKKVKMESTNLTLIKFNYSSTWVTKIETKATVSVNDSKKTTEKRISKTITIQ